MSHGFCQHSRLATCVRVSSDRAWPVVRILALLRIPYHAYGCCADASHSCLWRPGLRRLPIGAGGGDSSRLPNGRPAQEYVSILAQGLHSAERYVQQSDASAPLCTDRSVLAAASAGRRVTVPEAAPWRDVCGHWRVSRHRAPERPARKGCAWAAAFARSPVALERMEARGGFLPNRESVVSPRYTALCNLWRRHVRLA